MLQNRHIRPAASTRRSALWAAMLALSALGAAVLAALSPSASQAQGTGAAGDELFFQAAAFRIPFTVPQDARVYQAKLFVSRDQGVSWKYVAAVRPEAREFTYTSNEGDGSYWFAVQTVTPEGTAIPPEIRGNNNGQVLRVVVDSRPPTVELNVMHGQDGTARVDWKIYDEHLKLETLALEYRVPPGNQWFPIYGFTRQATGSHTWAAGSQPIEVRMLAQDRAGNIGKGIASSAPQGSGLPPGSGSPLPDRKVFQQPDSEIKYVNSRQIKLKYDVQDVGKSGISKIEIWRKSIPGGWEKVPAYVAQLNVNQKPLDPLLIDLGPDEGLFGYTLIAKSGVDVGLPPPTGGDPPQITVRVDRTPPVVKIGDIVVGRGANAGRVTITWDARDKDNLMGRQCITIYAARDGAPWQAIHSGQLENIGQYIWVVPTDPDPKLNFKVEAEDWAHNIGEDVRKDVIIDLTAPRASIQGVEPHRP